jgi:site-specific recombinase XerD
VSSINPSNERIKRRYFHRMAEADGLAEATIEAAARSIADYERFTGWKDLRDFHEKDALGYKKHLLKKGGRRAAELSNRSTVHTRLRQVQRFLRWLSGEPGYKSHIRAGDVEFLSLSRRDLRIANEAPGRATPSLEQVQHVIRSMPSATDVEKRDRALVALTLLTGVRVSACISLKLKHVRVDRQGIDQDGREVRTKLGKTHSVFFFPVGEDIRQMFLDYVDHLRRELLWRDHDPLFGRNRRVVDNGMFVQGALEPRHWATPGTLWRTFKHAFQAAGVPYHTPHSLRRTLTRVGESRCTSPEQLKAWSQNLGHDEVLTTLMSYGAVPLQRQATLISQLNSPGDEEAQGILRDVAKLLSNPRLHSLLQSNEES